MGENERIFTDQELEEMGRPTLELVLEAIDAGNKEKAKILAQRMFEEMKHLHDGYFTWVTGLQTYIYEHMGVDAVEEAERKAHTIESRVVWPAPEETDFRGHVENLLSGLRGHFQPITVREDDEKVTVTMEPCGSGERLIRKGGYESGLARVKEAHPITWGLKNFPLYCTHCPVMEMLDIENNGDFGICHFISDPIGKEHCQFVLYKDNANIPEEFYTRIGKKKPTR